MKKAGAAVWKAPADAAMTSGFRTARQESRNGRHGCFSQAATG
jgi:hypothetical protein